MASGWTTGWLALAAKSACQRARNFSMLMHSFFAGRGYRNVIRDAQRRVVGKSLCAIVDQAERVVLLSTRRISTWISNPYSDSTSAKFTLWPAAVGYGGR